MAGYYLIEERFFQPQRRDGFSPNERDLGIVDYLRELRREPFPADSLADIRITGFEDLLIGAGRELDAIARQTHGIMVARANELSALGKSAQVLFRRELRSADDFWFEVGRRRISLRRIFGTPRLENDRAGNEYYFVGFNLT